MQNRGYDARTAVLNNRRAAEQNSVFAATIIDSLIQHGVHTFCIAPGSRSTPLILAIAEHPLAEPIVHFDERALAFFALGRTKATKTPVAVITTSGSAVGNLLPALMEAHASRNPLILLTADRPRPPNDTGANQTTTQSGIFAPFTRFTCTLQGDCDPHYLSSIIAQAHLHSKQGPIHINCPFDEPLFSPTSTFSTLAPTVEAIPMKTSFDRRHLGNILPQLLGAEKGVVVVGKGIECPKTISAIADLTTKLGWPLITDVLARSYTFINHKNLIRSIKGEKPDFVLHFGDQLVSKKLMQWVTKAPTYYTIQEHTDLIDPLHSVQKRFICPPLSFCEELLPRLPKSNKSPYLKDTPFQIDTDILSEPALFDQLQHWIPENCNLFVGNSMPIRTCNTFFFPTHWKGRIFANRGVSGIDGNIATICGITSTTKQPMIAIIGDQTALHDLTSLSLIQKLGTPLILIVINNSGGAIFSHLPIGQKKEICSTFFNATHTWNFKHAAAQFNLPYHCITDLPTLQPLIENCSQSTLIEVITNPETDLNPVF